MMALNQLVAKLYRIKIEYIALPISIALFFLILHLKYFNYILLVAAIPAGTIIYIVLNKRDEVERGYIEETHIKKILDIVFIIFYTLSFVSLLYAFYEKPIFYFIFVALCGGAIATEILFVKNTRINSSIAKIFMLCLILFLSDQLIFPYGVGGPDAIVHLSRLVFPLVNTGHSIGIASEYEYFPGHHIFVAITSLIASIDPEIVYYGLGGFAMSLGVLFSFLIGKKLMDDDRVGLMASLLYISCDRILFHASYPTQSTYSLVLVLILFYTCIFTVYNNKEHIGYLIAFLMLSTAIIFTHHHTSMLVLIMLLSLLIAETFKRIEDPGHNLRAANLSLFFFVALFSHWIYYSHRMTSLEKYLKLFYDALFLESGGGGHAVYSISFSPAITFFNTISSALLILVATIGVLYLYKRHFFFENASVIISIILLLLIGIGTVFSVAGLLPHRTYAFLQMLGLIYVGAVGLCYMAKKLKKILIFLLIFSLIFFSAISITAESNASPLLNYSPYYKLYDTPYDRFSDYWLGGKIEDGMKIYKSRSIKSHSNLKYEWLPILVEGDELQIDEGTINRSSFILFSKFDFKPGFRGVGGESFFGRLEEDKTSFEGYNKYYDIGMIIVYYKGE
jgi:hypothetical protein